MAAPQAAEVRTGSVCGVDMSPINRHRWTPAFTAGAHCSDHCACRAQLSLCVEGESAEELPSIEPHAILQAGVPLAESMYRPLSEPVEAWHFDITCPPQDSGRRTLDVAFTSDGICNAVVFWYELRLCEGATLSSEPRHAGRPASQGAQRILSTCHTPTHPRTTSSHAQSA
jgi:protein arginine N-methyltransferase 7